MDDVSCEQLLDRFRQWLEEVRYAPEPADEGTPSEEFGLYRFAEEFTALRQELKLQTKSARGLQDQADAMLAGLGEALAALEVHASEARVGAAVPSAAGGDAAAETSLALALAELDEALDRGRMQLEKSAARLVADPEETLLAELDAFHASQSWLRRRWCGGYVRALRERIESAAERSPRRKLAAALVEGYGLIQGRLSRALNAAQIFPIPAVGELVDPEQMIVVEVVVRPEFPAATVVEEVRRGYTYRGRLLRPAEVRATPADDLEMLSTN